MLEDVLKAVIPSSSSQIIVLGSDPAVKEVASKFGVKYIKDKKLDLNQAIKQVTHYCVKECADAVLILPADIPLIVTDDIQQINYLCSKGFSLVISPSLDGGTNALCLKPPNVVPTFFGDQSFQRHKAEAMSKGISFEIYNSDRVAFDIDTPKDIEILLKLKVQTLTQKVLKQMRIQIRLNLNHTI